MKKETDEKKLIKKSDEQKINKTGGHPRQKKELDDKDLDRISGGTVHPQITDSVTEAAKHIIN